jgi:hypothetical protein
MEYVPEFDRAVIASRKQIKKFRVYFSRINQNYYDVESHDEVDARRIAKQLWRNENGPEVISTEEI